jgi:hypothetical protein
MVLSAAVVAVMILGGLLGAWINGQNTPPAASPAATQRPASQRTAADARRLVPPGRRGRAGRQPAMGDRDTNFMLHGRGWVPGSRVTVQLAGQVSRIRPVVDRAGALNYAINQDHEYFVGTLPPGHYTVAATADGHRSEARFEVHP